MHAILVLKPARTHDIEMKKQFSDTDVAQMNIASNHSPQCGKTVYMW